MYTWHHLDALLIKIKTLGVAKAANLDNYPSAKPVYGGVLAADEIIAVLSYIKSTWPKEIQQGHDAMNELYSLERQWRNIHLNACSTIAGASGCVCRRMNHSTAIGMKTHWSRGRSLVWNGGTSGIKSEYVQRIDSWCSSTQIPW